MDLKDQGPDEPWPPQQFWECPQCGRHFWTTYPPPKKPAPAKTETSAKPTPSSGDTPKKPTDPEAPEGSAPSR